MRIVLVTYGSEGDSRPFLVLAWALKKAGHDVVLLSDDTAAPLARGVVEFRSLGGNMVDTMTNERFGAVRKLMESGQVQMTALTELAREHTEEWVRQIDAAAAGADAIVGSSLAVLQALSVADTRGIMPFVATYQPVGPTREFSPALSGRTDLPTWLNRPLASAMISIMWRSYRGPINRVRREMGHPPARRMWDDYLSLCAFSPTLVPPPADWEWASGFSVTGDWHPPIDHPTLGWANWQPDPELEVFLAAGEKPVYVGFGSMVGFGHEDRVRDTILKGLAGRRVLLAGGWAGLDHGDLPENVHPVGRVPHDWLFPRCSAVIHHCGAGTTHAAVRAGVPVIPIPIVADQPFWADRLRRLGMASRALDRHTLTVADVREALADVTRPCVAEQAAAVAARVVKEDGVGRAVELIEERLREANGAGGSPSSRGGNASRPGVRPGRARIRDRFARSGSLVPR